MVNKVKRNQFLICEWMNVYFVSEMASRSDGQAYKMTLPWLTKLSPNRKSQIWADEFGSSLAKQKPVTTKGSEPGSLLANQICGSGSSSLHSDNLVQLFQVCRV